MLEIKNIFPLDIIWLKQNCKLIHYFGLGFIQLKINQEYRLHFYTSRLPPIISEEDIHNHRYDFTSMILKGTLNQEIFSIIDGSTHVMQEKSCQPNNKVQSAKTPCGIKLITRQDFYAGSQYWIDHDTFHRVAAIECITLLRRSDYKKTLAQVVRKKDSSSVCPFSKQIEEKELWDIIKEIVKR